MLVVQSIAHADQMLELLLHAPAMLWHGVHDVTTLIDAASCYGVGTLLWFHPI